MCCWQAQVVNVSFSQMNGESGSGVEIPCALVCLDDGVIELDDVPDVESILWRTKDEEDVVVSSCLTARQRRIKFLNGSAHDTVLGVRVS